MPPSASKMLNTSRPKPPLPGGNKTDDDVLIYDVDGNEAKTCGKIRQRRSSALRQPLASLCHGIVWKRIRGIYLQIFLSVAVVVSYIFLGSLAFSLIESRNITYIEGLYWAVVTSHTVGYGDIVPQTTSGKWFAIAYIVFGVTVMVGFLSYIVSLVASLRREQESIGRSKLPTLRSIIMDAVWACVAILVIVAVGTVFCTCYEPMSTTVLEGIYLSVVTLTTVGYGDVQIPDDNARLFFVFYIFCGVATFGTRLGALTSSVSRYSELKSWKRVLNAGMTEELLDEIVEEKLTTDGLIDQSDFILFFLVKTGKITKHQVAQVQELFARLDTDGSGSLDVNDIRPKPSEEQPDQMQPSTNIATQTYRHLKSMVL